MIINFDRGYGQTPEQMIQSLMESTQMALDNSDRAATTNHEMLQSSIAALEKKIGQGGGTGGSITTKQFNKSATVAAGSYAGVSYSATDIAIEGYTPIGLVGVSVTGSNNTKINQYRWSSKSSDADYPYIGIQNYGSASATVTVTITVLYYNNDNVVYGERGPKGDTGATGATGPRGLQGETGPQGIQGIQGEIGPSGNDGVSCTHSWNGTTLTVTSASGTSSADLKGPQGEQGPQGIQGPAGESITGPQGPEGPQGPKGDPGTIDETTRAAIVAEVKNGLFPIGYIYMSISDTEPSTMFGGEWTRIKDQFLLAAGDTYSAGSSGGSADAVAVEHTHTQEAHSHSPNNGHYFVSAKVSEANNTRVAYSSNGNRYVDGGTASMGFSHRVATDSKTPEINSAGEDGTGKNMPPYLTVYMWQRTA